MILDWADSKVVYRRYASLFFVCGIGSSDNELVTLEIIHRYVEVLDRYFGNVSRLAHSISLIMDSRNHRCANLTCEYPRAWTERSADSLKRIFNFQKAYAVCVTNAWAYGLLLTIWKILDELIIAGELQESSKKSVLRVVSPVCDCGVCAADGWMPRPGYAVRQR